MSISGVLKAVLLYVTYSFLLCNLITAHAVTPKYWQTSAYAFEGNNTPITSVLQDFSDSFGVNLVMVSQINGLSNGWKRSESAVSFLDQLSQEYKLQWFVYNQNLYISSLKDNRVERLLLKPNVSAGLKAALVGIGLFEKKFGWGEFIEEGIILVSGPRKYINLIKAYIVDEEYQDKSSEIFIFPLNHALVVDRTIRSRGETTVIPGVATILQSLLEGKRRSNNGLDIPEIPNMLNSKNKTTTTTGINSSYSQKRHSKHKTVVEADVRTNSIIIKSSEKNYSYYKKLIDKLDISQNLVEIDAVIVDINTNKLDEIGVDWNFNNNNRKNTISTSTILGSKASLSANATISIDELGFFYTKIKALEETGDASIVANTSILTMENQPAVIDLSETEYIQTVSERVADVQSVTAGTLLNVTPSVLVKGGLNKIILTLEIEDGSIEKTKDAKTPSVIKATINTKALIAEHSSLVVGGYHMHSTEKNIKRVPFFGNLPVIGSLFSSETQKNTNKERLFILTPKVSNQAKPPSVYTSTGNKRIINNALVDIDDRWQKASQAYLEQAASLFVKLVNGQQPTGYHLKKNSNNKLGIQCQQANIDFDIKHPIIGNGLVVYMGAAKNLTENIITVNETSCRGRGIIAVLVFPNSQLKANEEKQFYIALEASVVSSD
ncbi:type III secretion system outer membrane ring subunit SctC [Endozoicomonas sp. SM1973]|uniref:Type III secretion system outer membrane ring subunit SctC n=1 Tax=Spartinivicinus marinus TaxID=2994442 RepID=A0A853I9E4_9GAMM|nr:type III secretion system outer membrane ring subunit SctC [Spartinivicinus marinus]MCX4028158.1 type III secretion system outer membrane ring subunit SctC [Spartinivicinus marinus]NYZ66167.1 type III secretion system outer membrane ring subunit SctC [Spartinivicinus marinus]